MKSLRIILVLLLFSLNVGAVSTTSIYNLKSHWTNQDGKTMELASFKGRLRIQAMVFTRCSATCPLIVSDIKMILSKLPEKVRKEVSVDLFSFDYERDKPEALKAFTQKMKIEDSAWNIFTSDKSSIADLAAVLGVQYKKLAGGSYVHSNNIILIDQDGEVVKSISGYGDSGEDFIKLVTKRALL